MRTVVICDVDGTLTDGTVWVNESGHDSLRFHKRDGWLIQAAKDAGMDVALITDDPNTSPVECRAAKIGADYHPGIDKLELVRLHLEDGWRVVYVCDGTGGDLEAMELAHEVWMPCDAAGWDGHHRRTHARGGKGVLYEVLRYLLAQPRTGALAVPERK